MLFKGLLLHKVWDLVVFLCPIGQYWLGWFAFFHAFANIAGMFGFSFPCLSFSECCIFSKKSCISCFSEALLLVMRIWWVEGLSFHTVRFYWRVAEVLSVKTVEDLKWYDFVRLRVAWAVWVCLQYSEDGNTHTQFTNRPGPCSVLPFLPALVCRVYFYSHHLLLTVILNLLNLPFQHAQSKDIFPHLCIGFWCTFFMICVILVWW